MRTLLILLIVLVVLLAAFTSPYTVDRAEYVYLTRFGAHVATHDGADDAEAGLHFKWPWPVESVQRLDRRLQYFDLPGTELLTHDPRGETIDKTLTVDAYVCWRIAGEAGADRFIRAVGTPERARAILGQRISSELGAAIGRMELDELISVEPGKVDQHREALRQQLLDGSGLRGRAREEYGIEVVDVRLRRSNHPPGVRDAIYDRIRSERNKKVADYQSEGQKQAEDIRSASRRKVTELLAEARAKEQEIKGQADAEADRIRNQAQARDPQFYAFLKKLEEYQRILGDNKTVLLLSAHRDLFDLLLKPPKPDNGTPPRTAASPPLAREPGKGGP